MSTVRSLYEFLTELRREGYAGDLLPELDRWLDGDTTVDRAGVNTCEKNRGFTLFRRSLAKATLRTLTLGLQHGS